MANVYRNKFTGGWSGASGDPFVVHKTGSGKTILAGKPLFDDSLAYTERQPMHQAAVRDSALYACFAENQDAYICRAQETGMSAYALAISDWYVAPKVMEINIDGWRGQAGEIIRVKARDNVMVARVRVVIRDTQGQILEMGEAVQSKAGSVWWNYITQSPMLLTPFPSVQAIAFDLPGNRDSFTVS